MNIFMQYITASLVGSIIGYITNWLAIKMLFKPYNEVKILGFKLPFTPGLIPKEKNRIAKSVGETIGKHLLTQETIVDALCSDAMNKKLEQWVEKKISELKNEEKTVKEKLEAVLGDNFNKTICSVDSKLSEYCYKYINREDTKEKLVKLISNIQCKTYISVKKTIVDNIKGNKILIEEILDHKLKEKEEESIKLKEILPKEAISLLENLLYKEKYNITMIIKGELQEEKNAEKIKLAIGSMVASNLNPMIAMFLKPDTIYSKLMPALYKYMDEEETQNTIVETIIEALNKLLQKETKEITEKLSKEDRKNILKVLCDFIVDSTVTEENIDLILEKITKDGAVETLSKKAVDYIVQSEDFKGYIEALVKAFIEKILNIKLSNIIKDNEQDIIKVIRTLSRDIFNKFIENEAKDVIETLDIPAIVEEKINSFEVDYAEKIILEISKKELSAITWLGALLGAIMGLLSPLLGRLY